MKFVFFLILFSYSFNTLSFTKGFNQAWMKNDFGTQWLDGVYDEKYAEDLILLNKASGSDLLRLWLFEGKFLSQFTSIDGKFQIKPEVLKNLAHFLALAKKHELKINLTFLDGNAYRDMQKTPELLSFWWNIFNDRFGGLDQFIEAAVHPIYALIKQYPQTVTQIDIMNEVNALIHLKMLSSSKQLSRFVCKMKQGSPVPVTASLGWGKAENVFFSGLLKEACLDFYDIHFYSDTGTIPRCSEFKRFSAHGIPLQLGEFGQLNRAFDDDLQMFVTKNFLQNAKRCGFTSALAWRLEDSRIGDNPEARFSYISFGKIRPALEVFKNY